MAAGRADPRSETNAGRKHTDYGVPQSELPIAEPSTTGLIPTTFDALEVIRQLIQLEKKHLLGP